MKGGRTDVGTPGESRSRRGSRRINARLIEYLTASDPLVVVAGQDDAGRNEIGKVLQRELVVGYEQPRRNAAS